MIEEDIEDYLDDPIRLFDSEQNRVCFHVIRKKVIIEDSDDVEEKEPQIQHRESMYSNESRSSILPITFFDIDRNVELLKRCCPLIIKLVDCEKYPWYFIKNTVLTIPNNFNADKIVLQEADCIEILSSGDSGEINDNENYDIIIKRNTLEDIYSINKELNRIRFESENKSVIRFNERTTREDNEINNLTNHNNIDFKKNKGVIGLKISQNNVMINNKSDERKIIPHNCCPASVKETYVDKTNTYARWIDQSYRNTENVDKSSRTDSGKHFEKDQNIDKTKLLETLEAKHLDDIGKNNLNDRTNKNRRNVNDSALFSKLSQFENTPQIFSNKNEHLLVSETKSFKPEHLIPDKNKVSSVNIKETQSTGTTLDNKNGSTSPLLPCPSLANKTSNLNKITILSDIALSSDKKQSLKNNSVCKNHLYSDNRVIPHYHNETIRKKKQIISSELPQNIPKKTIEKNKASLTHHENVASKINGFNYKIQNKLKQCNKDKKYICTDVDVDYINKFTYNIQSKCNSNQISLLKPSKPNFSNKRCTSHSNFNQKIIENKFKVNKERKRRPEVTIPSDVYMSDETKSNKHPVTVKNIPIILRRTPQCTHKNNVNRSTFPIQTIVSNRDHFQTNNLIVTSGQSTIRQRLPHMHQNNIFPKHINNNFYTTDDSLCSRNTLETTANGYGHRPPTLYTMSQQPLSNLKCSHRSQVDPRLISNINIKHHIGNYEYPLNVEDVNRNRILLNDENNFRDSYENETKKSVENIKNNEIEASAYVNKHPYLKKSLEQPLLKMSKSDAKNKINDKQICQNNNSINISQNNNDDKTTNVDNSNKVTIIQNNTNSSNANKEAMVVALLATDYVNEKVSRMEENIMHKSGREASLLINKNTHLMQNLEPLSLEVTKLDCKNTENNPKINQNNIINVKNVSKGYSPPVLPITTYQKTFEILAKIKLYDLEKKSNQPYSNNIVGGPVSPQNARKRKSGETKQKSRKITISEYKKRKSAMETVNVEDYEVNVV